MSRFQSTGSFCSAWEYYLISRILHNIWISVQMVQKFIVLMIYHVLFPLTNTHNMHQYLTEYISFTAEQIWHPFPLCVLGASPAQWSRLWADPCLGLVSKADQIDRQTDWLMICPYFFKVLKQGRLCGSLCKGDFCRWPLSTTELRATPTVTVLQQHGAVFWLRIQSSYLKWWHFEKKKTFFCLHSLLENEN